MFPGLVLYPLTWLAEGAAAGWLADRMLAEPEGAISWLVGLVVLLLAPLTGWVALRFHDTRRRFFHEVRAYLVLALRRQVAGELKTRRAQVLGQISELVGLYRAEYPAD